ncbi:hypothetical protein [Corynebacterium silvaticum]|uniref:Uncharacterized protein n=1 Tax=Corynebacterium silvaticum TaxID=2320431 RepID=A0ACD4PZB4_9CORY|nr:hypothetical protein [Corynebacterium silvaticum]WCV10588.1 hypothetical protein CBE74_12850 [Corynebacterium silvaticum]
MEQFVSKLQQSTPAIFTQQHTKQKQAGQAPFPEISQRSQNFFS